MKKKNGQRCYGSRQLCKFERTPLYSLVAGDNIIKNSARNFEVAAVEPRRKDEDIVSGNVDWADKLDTDVDFTPTRPYTELHGNQIITGDQHHRATLLVDRRTGTFLGTAGDPRVNPSVEVGLYTVKLELYAMADSQERAEVGPGYRPYLSIYCPDDLDNGQPTDPKMLMDLRAIKNIGATLAIYNGQPA